MGCRQSIWVGRIKKATRFESPIFELIVFLIWSDNLPEETEITGMSIAALCHRHFPCHQLPRYQPRLFYNNLSEL